MTTMQHEGRTREPRKTEEQRRRRKADGGVIGKRLAVNETFLDFNRYAYRWINDDPARIMAKTKQDDWDIVLNDGGVMKEDSADIGAAVSQIVGTKTDGSPKVAYLCRKPKKYFDEDQAAKIEELDRQISEMRRGNAPNGDPNSDYVPAGGIRI